MALLSIRFQMCVLGFVGAGIVLEGGVFPAAEQGRQSQQANLSRRILLRLPPTTADLEALSAPFNRPLSVSLSNVTAREVLSTVAAAAGDISWVVRYASEDGAYEGSEIMLAAPGPSNVLVSARRKK